VRLVQILRTVAHAVRFVLLYNIVQMGPVPVQVAKRYALVSVSIRIPILRTVAHVAKFALLDSVQMEPVPVLLVRRYVPVSA